jgi:hypothetical protein
MIAYNREDRTLRDILSLIAGPIMGLIYVISLPFVAIAMVVVLIGRKALGGVLSIVRSLISFGWRPTEAYLGGKKEKKTKKRR